MEVGGDQIYKYPMSTFGQGDLATVASLGNLLYFDMILVASVMLILSKCLRSE